MPEYMRRSGRPLHTTRDGFIVHQGPYENDVRKPFFASGAFTNSSRPK
jgi:hypothetical protein